MSCGWISETTQSQGWPAAPASQRTAAAATAASPPPADGAASNPWFFPACARTLREMPLPEIAGAVAGFLENVAERGVGGGAAERPPAAPMLPRTPVRCGYRPVSRGRAGGRALRRCAPVALEPRPLALQALAVGQLQQIAPDSLGFLIGEKKQDIRPAGTSFRHDGGGTGGNMRSASHRAARGFLPARKRL